MQLNLKLLELSSNELTGGLPNIQGKQQAVSIVHLCCVGWLL